MKLVRIDFREQVFVGNTKVDHVVFTKSRPDKSYGLELDDENQMAFLYFKHLPKFNMCVKVPYSNITNVTYEVDEKTEKKQSNKTASEDTKTQSRSWLSGVKKAK